MSDIVKRLRAEVERVALCIDRDHDDLCAEAADEIERLRAERDRMRAALRNAGDVIENYSPEVITSTVWLSSHETLVDYLRAVIGDADT